MIIPQPGIHQSLAETVLERAMRLSQIASGVIHNKRTGETIVVETEKNKAVVDILLDTPRDQKIVIWTVHRATLPVLLELVYAQDRTAFILAGGNYAKNRHEELEKFAAGEYDICIATPGAGSTGIDQLSIANVVIWYSLGTKWGDYEQARGRTLRGGSERHESIVEHYLITQGTIEEQLYASLQKKEKKAQLVNRLIEWGIADVG